ncbi:hypothetical protein B0H14DRAFT_3693418 [Mycena olivaceomarginata]|nr:hypothetical protein B0H14DRAFT_3693418 [Mycena olivaceomarginata]
MSPRVEKYQHQPAVSGIHFWFVSPRNTGPNWHRNECFIRRTNSEDMSFVLIVALKQWYPWSSICIGSHNGFTITFVVFILGFGSKSSTIRGFTDSLHARNKVPDTNSIQFSTALLNTGNENVELRRARVILGVCGKVLTWRRNERNLESSARHREIVRTTSAMLPSRVPGGVKRRLGMKNLTYEQGSRRNAGTVHRVIDTGRKRREANLIRKAQKIIEAAELLLSSMRDDG